jgi:fructokinase
LIDLLPDGEGRWHAVVGGSPCNVARGLGRLGLATTFVGAISTDTFGDQIVAELIGSGVQVGLVTRLARPTTLSFVALAEGGAQYAFYASGAADRYFRAEDPARSLAGTDAVHFGSNSLFFGAAADEFAALMAAAAGTRFVSFDPNILPRLVSSWTRLRARYRELAPYADVVKLSKEDLGYLAPERAPEREAEQLIAGGASLVVVTAGAAGATAYTAAHTSTCPAIPVEVADTIGAGDGFMVGLLAALADAGRLAPGVLGKLTEDDLGAALELATRVAATVCARRGAVMPTRQELVGTGGRDQGSRA